MKTKNLIERLSLFLLALVLAAPAWAQGSSGNESETITIASKEDWKAFCDRVNKGQTTLNAKLTKDVDLGEEIVMVGKYEKMYSGTFDGQGHTLKFNWNRSDKGNLAPFWCVKDATIRNLRTQGKITTKGFGLSGLIREANGTTTITGCASDVEITGGRLGEASQAAGMVLVVARGASVQITDCLVKGSITDNAWESQRGMAGFVYWAEGSCTMTRCLYVGKNNSTGDPNSNTFAKGNGTGTTLTDCYYLNACGEAQGTQVSEAQVKYGALAYKLQAGRTDNIWGQSILTDNEPLPTALASKHVYKVDFTYNGNTVSRYTNYNGNIVGGMPTAKELVGADFDETKTYTMIFDGGFEVFTLVTADITVPVQITAHVNDVAISTAADWKAFCQRVNGGEHNLNGRLTQDIDLGTEIVQVGRYLHPYVGTFDGQNHTLTINWQGEAGATPFLNVENGAVIKNLRIKGKITVDESNTAGLAYAVYGNVTISNCITDVDITGGHSGEPSNAGGLISGVGSAHLTITDCVVMGSITDRSEESVRQLAGFIYTDWADCTMTNCLYLGTNNASDNGKCHTFLRKGGTFENCYYLNASGTLQGEQVTAEQLKSGEVAYKLQAGRTDQVWGQTLGTDTVPLLTNDATKQVYGVKFTYNGNEMASRYANNAQPVFGGLPTAKDILGTGYNPQNTYTMIFDGGNFTAETLVTEDKTVPVSMTVGGTFEIATKDDWKVFCALVAGGQTGINAKMTADVDLGTDIAMVGTTNNLYGGTFDGQNHTLTVNWDAGSANDVAPFRRVSGATIKNLRTEGAIRSDSYYLGGLIDEAIGENTVTGCVSNVNLTTSYDYSSCDAAGLICYIYTTGRVTISDCLVKGSINATGKKGRRGMGGFVYVQNGTLVMNNCLYAGTNNASGGYTFASDSDDEATTTLNNCYYLNPCGKAQGERIVEKQLKSGEVTKKLQGDRTDKCYWAQQLGEMPDFYNAADKSKANYVYYNKENNGWTCDDFRLTDGQSLPIGLDFTATKATYDRTLAAGKATLCLPYELPVQGFRAYTLADRQESRTAVHFEKVSGTLGAYRPYLLVADGTLQLGGENLQVKADRNSSVLYSGDYAFSGAVQEVVNSWLTSDHAYILQADGLFHKVTSNNPSVTVPAYRAYISYNSHEGAKPLSIVIDGETTGIGGATNDARGRADGPVYDLQGRRVADRLDDAARHRLPAGVYIVGGRKVIVK